ncbi:hypothetical protein E3N88_16041 [Mikania micrantha]|uniref:Uncharacterized protein n=1 Tax=Mikania micrantha TaxID=192012 RepID=A0A5N6NZ01_9ASTR|nr:hypothetical protein E3N88_16041 [Mikania micrantha]
MLSPSHGGGEGAAPLPAPGSFPVTPLAASTPTNSSTTLGHQGDDQLGPHPRWGGVVCKPALARDGRVGLKLQTFRLRLAGRRCIQGGTVAATTYSSDVAMNAETEQKDNPG